jgi:hypothetical protein
MEKSKILVVHESILASWLKDIVSFVSFAALLYFNHRVLGGRVIIDVLFVILLLIWSATKRSKAIHTFYSYKDARDYVNSKEFPNEEVKHDD